MLGAAHILGVKESSISRTIHSCEAALGVRLFDRGRGRRALQPTAVGEELLPLVRDLLQAFERLDAGVSRAPVETLTLSCYPAHITLALAPVLTEFSRTHPTARVRIDEASDLMRRDLGASLFGQLKDHRVDLVIGPSQRSLDLVAARYLYGWHLVAVASPSASQASNGVVRVADLLATDLLTSPRGHASRTLLDASFVPLNFTPSPLQESESVAALVALARGGVGTAVLPSDALPGRTLEDLDVADLVDEDEQTIGGSYSIYSRNDSAPGARDQLIDDLVEAIATCPQTPHHESCTVGRQPPGGAAR